MKKFIELFTFVSLMGLMISCVEEVVGPEDVQEGQVAFIISDFKSSGQTKSAFQITDSNLKFQWSADDAIGIFPESGWQTEFSMEEGAGTSVAVFDGGSWGLKKDATYYAYYPFSADNFESKDMRERVKYSYVGQEACFADENGVVDLSGYDFMASGESTVENGSVSFRFAHLGALCRLRFAAPATADYSYFVLESEGLLFPMSGYYDATGKGFYGMSLMADSSALETQFRVDFPADNQTFAEGDIIELYFLMPPVDLTWQTLTLKIFDKADNNYDFEIEPKNIEAGMSYSWNVNVVTPLGPETANSYIVSEAGMYSFPTVKGNSFESVGAVASVEVLWETYGTDTAPEAGDLVSEPVYSDGKITFKASDKKGNALIAAKDSEGTVLWSWHIWMTDQPEDQVYRNNAGTMMDRNLGATSATPGDVGALGLLYQWGRKDPFLGSSSISVYGNMAKSTLTSWPTDIDSDVSQGTIAYATANPTTFILGNDNNKDWYYSADETTDDTRWQVTKTIYDPCPAGYQVPEAGYSGVWYYTLGTNYISDEAAYDSGNRGFDFAKGSMTEYYFTEEGTCWYPAAGERRSSNIGSLVSGEIFP